MGDGMLQRLSDSSRHLLSLAAKFAAGMKFAEVRAEAAFAVAYEMTQAEVDPWLGRCGVEVERFRNALGAAVKAAPRGHAESLAISSDLERVLAFAAKIAAKMEREVSPLDIFCALGAVENPAKCVFERFGLGAKELDALLLGGDGGRAGRATLPANGGEVDWMAELDGLVGLASVKEEVRKLADMVKFNAARMRAGLPGEALTSNFVFTGNPGTGKSTVARIIAGIYRQLGALRKGHLVEVDRSRLVAGYVGQSEAQTKAVVDSALDGVLFIDEAYSLADGGSSDYGRQVVDLLVKRMEDDRERLVVIVAGYTDEMHRFIEMNPGLKSRFTKYIEFPDYTADELTLIFTRMAEKEKYIVSAAVRSAVRRKMAEVTAQGGRASGNARATRNFFKEVKERMARRVMADGRADADELREIRVEDIG